MRARSVRAAALFLLAPLLLFGCGGGSGSGGGAVAAEAPAVPVEVEPNGTPAEAFVLPASGDSRVRGTVSATGAAGADFAGDVDLFRVAPAEDSVLAVELDVPDGADFDLALLDESGRRLATARRRVAVERLYALVPGGAARLVAVGALDGPPGDYEIRFRLTPVPDGGDHPDAGPMKGARAFHGAALLPDGRASVGGGTTNATSPAAAMLSSVATTEIFDPVTGSFSDGPFLGVSRFGPTATALPDGRVLFAGGDIGGTAAIFDPATGTMERTDLPLASGSRLLHTATLLPDGRVLLAGGYRIVPGFPPSEQALATSEIFDPKTGAFSEGPELRAVRVSHAAGLLHDGRIILTGGVARSDSEVLDLTAAEPASTAGPALTANRDDHTLVVLADGRVLLAGGQSSGSRSVDTLEILDDPAAAASSTFRRLDALLSQKRSDHTAHLLRNGHVLLLGGELDPGNGQDEILTSVDDFDPTEETVTARPDMIVGRDDHRSLLLPDGRVLVTGGEDASSMGIEVAEIYAP